MAKAKHQPLPPHVEVVTVDGEEFVVTTPKGEVLAGPFDDILDAMPVSRKFPVGTQVRRVSDGKPVGYNSGPFTMARIRSTT